MKRVASLEHALRIINNGPVLLVATRSGQTDNICAVAWSTPLGKVPPRLALQINPGHFTWEQLADNPEFTLNVPGRTQLELVGWCGGISGRQCAKPGSAPVKLARGNSVNAPLLLDCLAHLECRAVQMDRENRRVTAEVVYACADEEAFFEGWTLRPGFEPLHHLGGEYYQCGGERLRQARLTSLSR